MARALQSRGHEITIATHEEYREQVERIGVQIVPLKPGLEELGPQESWAARANHPLLGTQFIVETLIMPYLEHSYRAIKAAAAGHDLIISHVLTFATPLVAGELNIPWVSTALQPSPFFSAYDPPALGPAPFLPKLKFLGPRFMRWFMRLLASPTNAWSQPVHELRKRIGLPPATSRNLLIDGYSPLGTLALFPAAFAAPEPDWPNGVKQIGFPLFDEESTAETSPGLQSFLASGPPPVVFTLGTAIVQMETPYFEIAYQAAKSLGLRAVFLAGKTPRRIPAAAATDPSIHISTYEPFSGLFPHGLAIVHQCGIGTTSQALASGRPQVLVPFAHDQPDNARIVARLGLGICIPARRLTAARLTTALKTVTQSEAMTERAEQFAQQVHSQNFGEQLCDAVSGFLEPTAATSVAPAQVGR
jgi:UDP:flavonoid glycosyltransferase YjiC (YdhE family)